MSKNIKCAIPKWRFESFDSYPKWDIKKLGCLMEPIKERAGDKKYVLMSVTSGVGLIPQVEKFGREIAGNSYKNYYVIRKNDFAYNKSSTKEFPEGYISMLKEYEEAAIPNSIFTCFRIIDDEYEPLFFDQLFNTNYHGQWLRKYIEIGARAHGALSIDTKHLWNMPVAVPKLPEQQKIANCLSSIDDLISTKEKKLSLLNDYKKGWMQKLFPSEGKTVPEWRFPEFRNSGEWTQKKLDVIGKFIRGFSYSSQDTTDDKTKLLVIRSNNIIPMGKTDYINNLRYVNKKCSKEQNLIFGDITICMANGSSNLIGKASFYDGGYAGDITVGAFCGIFRSPLPIVRYLFQTNQYNRELQRISQGGDGAIANLKEIDIKNIEFLLPALPEEQQKIAIFLSGIDDLISTQTDRREALKQHKKALMQGLFPSIEEVCK